MPRPPTKPPRGRLTLAAAAKRAGVSYGTAYARTVTTGTVPFERDASGVVTITAADVKLIKLRPRAADPRPAIMVRPTVEELKTWERAAGDRPVSSWLRELANYEAARAKR